ncbi:MAG: hypothetical protein B7Z66_07815 [Chromatiales bacterium 21-64-14]|nr:MAG: hypothetical protein B7Z66_07815 [Chromatiales bacterium 21-64-14]HQU15961.1 hypothetical protein [Gammaproteobacteria bacterium]
MSQLQLSDQLISAVQETLAAHDSNAREPGVAIQYLAAIIGYRVGKLDMPAAGKEDVLEQLAAFSRHVMQDICSAEERAQPQPPGPDAFGIWRAPR